MKLQMEPSEFWALVREIREDLKSKIGRYSQDVHSDYVKIQLMLGRVPEVFAENDPFPSVSSCVSRLIDFYQAKGGKTDE